MNKQLSTIILPAYREVEKTEITYHLKDFHLNIENLIKANVFFSIISNIKHPSVKTEFERSKYCEYFISLILKTEKKKIKKETEENLFFNDRDIYHHLTFFGSTGKGKSYFLPSLSAKNIQYKLIGLLNSYLTLQSSCGIDHEILLLNFEQDWNEIIKLTATFIKEEILSEPDN